MARKTFISYKYSEARGLRNEIITALGENASYYQGETADSPDMTDTSTENIKSKLTDKMYDTSVTIVIISPNMKDSNWIDWEIEYCLKEISRKGRTSKTNGVVGVIQEVNGGYDWLIATNEKEDGCLVRIIDQKPLYEIIKNNRVNAIPKKHTCQKCKCISQLNGSYIALIDQSDFLNDPDKYIENAFEKSENADSFDLTKQR